MLSQFCINRPVFASVLSILICLAGLIAGWFLPFSQYPEISPPTVMISTSYEGADSMTLARTVASPIEDQLSGIEGLSYFNTSIKSNGEIRITCTFEVGTDPNDAMLEINNRVRSAENSLPEVVRKNGVTVRKRSEETLMLVPVFSKDGSYTPAQLADFVNLNIIDQIKRVQGVGDVTIFGTSQSAMRIWLDPLKMAKLSVTVQDVSDAISDQNNQYSAGKIGTGPTNGSQQLYYTVRTKGQLLTPEEFGNIIILSKGADGIVRLMDISRIEVGNRSYEAYNMFNNVPSVTFAVYLQPGANSLQTSERVKATLSQISKHFPDNISYEITDDNSKFVQIGLNKVIQTLLEAIVLVLLVVFLFLQSIRATIIPMLAVPVSLIGTLAGLWMLNFSINTLTLFAMTLAIGIVVDDAIVVIENVQRVIDTENLSPKASAEKAMKEVGSALVAIVLVLSTVFIPVAFLGGIAGQLYRQFAVTICLSVVISGFVALTLSPALCALILKKKGKDNRFFSAFNSGFEAVKNTFARGVDKLLLRPWSGLIALAAAGGITVYLLQVIPTSFVPVEDQGILRMSIQLPEGAALDRTEEVVKELISEIRGISEVTGISALMANDNITNDSKPNASSLSIQLKDWDERKRSAAEVLKDISKIARDNPHAVAQVSNPPAVKGIGKAGGVEFFIQSKYSDDAKELETHANAFLEALRKRPEVASSRLVLNAESPQLMLNVDETKAISMGIKLSDIYNTVGCFLGGKYINDFTRNGKVNRVIVQADANFRMTPESLKELYVRNNEGKMVPLSSVATLTRIAGPESLAKLNGILAANMNAQGAPEVSSGELIRVIEECALATLGEDYELQWVGQAYQEKQIGQSSTIAFVFGLIVIFLVLAAQFEKWSLPFAVVLSIPFAIAGALVAVYVRGFNNDIYFQIGLLVLVGLSAKNAILVLEFAIQKVEEGMSVREAALEAARL